MPENSFDKRFPVRCLVCKSVAQPEGKVFECHAARKKVVDHFVRQHCKGSTHIAAVARYVQELSSESESAAPIQSDQPAVCEGQNLTGSDQQSSLYSAELLLWARFTNLSKTFSKHKYVLNVKEQTLQVFHEDCERVTYRKNPHDKVVCQKCQHASLTAAAVKSALRFALKWWAAKILRARLFQSDEQVALLTKEFKDSALYRLQVKRGQEMLDQNTLALQKWVRMSWMKVSKESITPEQLGGNKRFIKCIKMLYSC